MGELTVTVGEVNFRWGFRSATSLKYTSSRCLRTDSPLTKYETKVSFSVQIVYPIVSNRIVW